MATKTEFKKILKEFNLTEEQLQVIYEDVATTNSLVNNLLNISKIELQDLAPHLIRQLPTQKEKDLKKLEEKRIRDEQEAQAKLKAQQEKNYYDKNFKKIIVDKIDNGIELTESEIRKLIFGYGIETEYGENRRWSRSASTVSKLCDRFFMTEWDKGLTEHQENEFYNQPYEVTKHEYEKTIIVTKWMEIKQECSL